MQKGSVLIFALIGIVILLIVLGGGWYLYQSKPSPKVTRVIQTQGETTDIIALQDVPQNHKAFSNQCYQTIVPDPVTVVKDKDCYVSLALPDSGVMPYVKAVPAIYLDSEGKEEAGDAKTDIYKIKALIESQGDDDVVVEENVKVGKYMGHMLKYYDGVYAKRDYFVDQPTTSNQMVEGKRIKYYIFRGYYSDPEKDVFTQEYQRFLDNLTLK